MVSTVLLRALCAAALFAAPALCASADPVAPAAPSPSASPLPEIVHVVTSDRSDETLHNATRTTYVVTQEQIARHGYRTVGDALATVPAVEITRYGPIGQNVSYGIRGSSSSQVLVLVDGEPAPGEFANSVQLGTMSTAGIRRIEVVEGGGSTLYGAGAVGGIINVITDSQNAPASASVQLGTFDDREFQVQTYGLSFERIVAKNAYGLPPSADPVTGTANPSTRENSDDETTSVRYGLDRKAGVLDASVRAGIENDHLGAAGFFPYLSPTSREDDVNSYASFSLAHDGRHAATTLQLAGERQQIAFSCDAASDFNCFFPVPSLSTESRANLSLRNAVSSPSNRFLYGIDLSRGTVREDSGLGAPDSIAVATLSQSAAYLQDSREFSSGEVYGGLRGERDGSLGGEFSPSFGLRKQLSSALEFKVNAASAFRAPNASELYFPGYGNPALVPERAQVGDLALVDSRLLGGVTLVWFTNHTNGLIVPSIVGTDANGLPIYRPENVDHALMQGFTLDARTLSLHGVTLSFNATDLYRAEDIDTQSRLANDPVLSFSLALGVHGSGASFFHDGGITVRAAGARGAVDPTQPLFDQAAAYSTVDAFARFNIARGTLLALRGYNLGNERYAEVSGYPMPGRTFVVELSTK